jgi:hypothetical protein
VLCDRESCLTKTTRRNERTQSFDEEEKRKQRKSTYGPRSSFRRRQGHRWHQRRPAQHSGTTEQNEERQVEDTSRLQAVSVTQRDASGSLNQGVTTARHSPRKPAHDHTLGRAVKLHGAGSWKLVTAWPATSEARATAPTPTSRASADMPRRS